MKDEFFPQDEELSQGDSLVVRSEESEKSKLISSIYSSDDDKGGGGVFLNGVGGLPVKVEDHANLDLLSNLTNAKSQVGAEGSPIDSEEAGNPAESLETFSNELSAIKERPESTSASESKGSSSSDEKNPSAANPNRKKVSPQQNAIKASAKASGPKQNSKVGADTKPRLTLEEILKDIEAQEVQKRQALEARLEQEKMERLRMQEEQSKARIEKIEKIGILAYQHGLIDVGMDEFEVIFNKLKKKVTGVLKEEYAKRKAVELAKTGDMS